MNSKVILSLIIFTNILNALNFTVGSYNVENLFDLINNGTEYKRYIPNTKIWNKKILNIKLTNISKVINDMNVDILALQEIETKEALKLLLKKLPKYKYYKFLKNPNASIGVAIISKYPIINTKTIKIDSFDNYNRPILEATIKIKNKTIKILNNHWNSKRVGEHKRIEYAISLKKYIDNNFEKDEDYIILGDFNSNYNEFIDFINDNKLNNTYGITGINHILNTIIDNKFVLQSTIKEYKKKVLYNLWLELDKQQRYSAIFGSQKNTPDNILLPLGLFDNKNISYVDNSFKVFKPKYLFNHNRIFRWYKYKGYSDHLPIMATFSTKKFQLKPSLKTSSTKKITTLKDLYNSDNLIQNLYLKNVVVLYKNKNNAILKQINGRAIYAFNCAERLKSGYKYNLTIDKLSFFNGLLETKNIKNITILGKVVNYKRFYKDGSKINILNPRYINEIITNLKVIYKKGYFYFNNKRIKVYIPKHFIKLKQKCKYLIKTGHLSIYKGQMQIIIHKKNDIKQLCP